MCSTCKENNFMYLKEASIQCWLIITWITATNDFKIFTQATLMHESLVIIWPLALRKDVSGERCL